MIPNGWEETAKGMASVEMNRKKNDVADYDRGWEETRNFSPKDRELRDRGFRIHSRPKTGEAVWERDGVTFPQSEAEAIE